MRIFLYEWATGGGLVEELGSLPPSLVREGSAMISALAGDLVRVRGCNVSALRDPRVLSLALPGCEIIDVLSRSSHHEEFDRLAASADAVILVAPEFDSILLQASRSVRACGGNLLSPGPDFIGVAGNKHHACESLAAAGVPVPPGVLLDGDEPLPADFAYPAVLKPNAGAGSQDMYLLSGQHDSPPPYAWPRRLEQYVAGLAASVAVVCGPAGNVPLVPTRQKISEDGRLRYVGGELPLTSGLAQRGTALALRAIAALPQTTGYVGVDLVLGRDPHGDEDYVIEVNPRLTTSYLGLRAAAQTNLAQAMIEIVAGIVSPIKFSNRPLEFDSSGKVSYAA